MKTHCLLPAILAGATLVLLGANALPTTMRKHRLQRERERLARRLEAERARHARLEAEVDALRSDPFYLEKVLVETWNGVPAGARPWRGIETPTEQGRLEE